MDSSPVKRPAGLSVPRQTKQGLRGNLSKSTRNSGRRVNVKEIHFNPEAPELSGSWHKGFQNILCVNAYPNGISVSSHEQDKKSSFDSWQFHLRLRDTREFRLPQGKYSLYREDIKEALSRHLAAYHRAGTLDRTIVYFGTTSDAFISFQKRFEVTMACLEIFEKFKPGQLVVQTRSPMVISALPILKHLGERASVVIPVESTSDDSVKRYSPGQPRISERFVAASGLRRQGICVNLLVSPVLPYGDFYRDAWNFAELLDSYGDFVTFGSLAYGRSGEERELREIGLAKKLAADKKFHYLRPYSFRNIFRALSVIAPEKLSLPAREAKTNNQLDLFAA